MSWIIPENKLDTQQRDFLNNVDINRRNVWIKGFAGSGKSVLLAYTAKKVRVKNPSSSVLLIVFTQSLVEMFKAAFAEMEQRVSVDTYFGFMKGCNHYDYILCDEVQDLTPRVLREMNSRGSHVIVAGDSNQSIYESDPRWREATVTPSEVGRLINGDSFELGIIHRLSRSIMDAVRKFLPRMDIFSSKTNMADHDTQIRLCESASERGEVTYIMRAGTKSVNEGYSAAILIPSAKKIINFVNQALRDAGKPEWQEKTNQWGKMDFGNMNAHLKANGVKLQYVGNGYGKFSENDHRIVIMTYHSAKGLDFDTVYIPYANSSLYISPNESLAKTLFMVAMTRSKGDLVITYNGYPSDYLDAFKSNCHYIDLSSESASESSNSNTSSNSGNVWGF